MSAEESPTAETRPLVRVATALVRLEAQPSLVAERPRIDEVTESAVARALASLTAFGHHVLAGRSPFGNRGPRVDVLVGPAGVFLLATEAWKNVTILGERIYQEREEVTEQLDALIELRGAVEADLATVGLAPGEVRVAVVLAGAQGIQGPVSGVHVVGADDALRHVACFGTRLTSAQVSRVLARALTLFPPVVKPASSVVADPRGLRVVGDADGALLDAAATAAAEAWMTFLDPVQAKLARRSFNGPARISGATGTGKTCVGLLRAAFLARSRPGTVLYTSNLRTLPGVLRRTLIGMAPDVADRVDFTHVHSLARRVLRERGVQVNVQPAQADTAMEKAWHDAGAPGLLGATGVGRGYWREEVEYVLKGRGITELEKYADLARAGRRHPLDAELRRAVWDLYQAYQDQLRSLGVHDDLDVVLLAEAELRRAPERGRFSAVIVDEAQDLTCAMLRMLHSYVGNVPDGLTLIGDSEQALSPGGCTLAEAWISLAWRGAVLDVNYRSTAQILESAAQIFTGEGRGAPATASRTGREPVIERCPTEAERGDRMVAWIRTLLTAARAEPGDIVVLCVSPTGVAQAFGRLMTAAIPVIELTDYGSAPVRGVRVGTIEQAKGLEFRQVVMGDVAASWLDALPDDDVERERCERRRRELYMGMTRAREGLWVGVV